MKRSGFYTKGNVNIDFEKSKTEACVVKKLVINGVSIQLFEIGRMIDAEPDKAAAGGCGNRVFAPKNNLLKDPIYLKKFNLDKKDYSDLISLLHEILDIGYCKRCR
ncbi:MAG: hypothetical protein LUE12_06400 [Ruminococcus sp.]|nr:hypothetical protein [Ruminococcus sp.]